MKTFRSGVGETTMREVNQTAKEEEKSLDLISA